MSFMEFYRYLMFAIALGVFVASFRHVNRNTLGPIAGILTSLGILVLGIALNGIGHLLGVKPWRGFWETLLFEQATIWHGTTFIAAAYGLLAFSLVRPLLPQAGRDESDKASVDNVD